MSEHSGGFRCPLGKILQLRLTALITYGMESRALSIFRQAGVAVLRANASTVREVIETFRMSLRNWLKDSVKLNIRFRPKTSSSGG